jgi:hypothetical protein
MERRVLLLCFPADEALPVEAFSHLCTDDFSLHYQSIIISTVNHAYYHLHSQIANNHQQQTMHFSRKGEKVGRRVFGEVGVTSKIYQLCVRIYQLFL